MHKKQGVLHKLLNTAKKYNNTQKLLLVCMSLFIGGCGVAKSNIKKESLPTKSEIIMAIEKQNNDSYFLHSLDQEYTLLGIDKNKNGIRDDLDKYITSLPDLPEQKKALAQGFFAANKIFSVNLSDKNELKRVAELNDMAKNCLFMQYKDNSAYKKMRQTTLKDYAFDMHLELYARPRKIEKYTFNTEMRDLAYARYIDSLRNQTPSLIIEEPTKQTVKRNTCQ
jgi:hypothetical protein